MLYALETTPATTHGLMRSTLLKMLINFHRMLRQRSGGGGCLKPSRRRGTRPPQDGPDGDFKNNAFGKKTFMV